MWIGFVGWAVGWLVDLVRVVREADLSFVVYH